MADFEKELTNSFRVIKDGGTGKGNVELSLKEANEMTAWEHLGELKETMENGLMGLAHC